MSLLDYLQGAGSKEKSPTAFPVGVGIDGQTILSDFFDSNTCHVLVAGTSGSGKSDCSLADGVRLMARDDKVRAIDIGDGWWQDVDTRQMLQHAERQMAKGMQSALT